MRLLTTTNKRFEAREGGLSLAVGYLPEKKDDYGIASYYIPF